MPEPGSDTEPSPRPTNSVLGPVTWSGGETLAVFRLVRLSSGDNDTVGALYRMTRTHPVFMCWTLEDEHRLDKVAGETRIPAGQYRLELRAHGGFYERYTARFPDIRQSRGMVEISDIPGFTDVLIHCGNDEGDTEGCPLVGDRVWHNVGRSGYVSGSADAYQRIYPQIAEAIETKGAVLHVEDYA